MVFIEVFTVYFSTFFGMDLTLPIRGIIMIYEGSILGVTGVPFGSGKPITPRCFGMPGNPGTSKTMEFNGPL